MHTLIDQSWSIDQLFGAWKGGMFAVLAFCSCPKSPYAQNKDIFSTRNDNAVYAYEALKCP